MLAPSLAARQDRSLPEPPRFRVSVDVVRLDAVATGRDGRVVPNLTADDFEVLQDGKPQKVTFAQFVPVLTNAVAGSHSPASARVIATSPSATTVTSRETVQRTIAIVVDDLGLSWESLHHAKQALRTFIDREMQPVDLVAIIRTGGSVGALQPFTTDRRLLHATIERLNWNGLSRNGVEAFEPFNLWTTFDERHGMGDPDDFKSLSMLRSSISAAGTLGALNLAIQGARDLPGRKAVIFVSEGFQMGNFAEDMDPDSRVRFALDRAIDQAARSGVVIYSLDARGLQTAGFQAADNLKRPSPSQTMDETVRQKAADRVGFNRDTQEALAYLAEQTGGFAVLNTNDLAKGLGRISQDVRDYYIIGYVPSEGTFAAKGKKPRYHKVSIRSRRPGITVRTRKEFLGVSDPDEPATSTDPPHQLVRAAISPFAETGIALRATALPGFSTADGMFVRALLHIDTRALAFTDEEAGRKTASADVLGMAFNGDGTQVAHLSTGFSVALTSDAADEALRDGLAYTLTLPIRRPGAYQVRFAVRDRNSGRLGSSGEFVSVPDMAGGEFALSGIVLRSPAEAVPSSGNAEALFLTPAQALRIYPPGNELSYSYELYNAAGPAQAAASLWRGTERVFTTTPDKLVPPAGGENRFTVRGRLHMGEALPVGNYVLQISAAAADSRRKGRMKTALQQVTFEVR